MRAFRNWTHAAGPGYCGYMQMTRSPASTARYVLNNLIDSLDKPYDEPAGETTGLMRLSTAMAESPGDVALGPAGPDPRAASSTTSLAQHHRRAGRPDRRWTTGSTTSTSTWSGPCSISSATTRGSRAACSSTSAARTSRPRSRACWAGSSRGPTPTLPNGSSSGWAN